MTEKTDQEQQETRPAGEARDLSILAGLTGGTSDRSVTLSGRCGTCGYFRDTENHETSCG